jgi:hypothetical protein
MARRHPYNQELSIMFELITERRFCTVAARSKVFATLAAYVAPLDGPFLVKTVSREALGVKFDNLSRYDRDMVTSTLRRLGFELRRPHWCRRDAEARAVA